MAKDYALRGKKLGFLVSFICTTGFLLFGYDQGLMSGLIEDESFNYNVPETYENETMQGFVTAIYEIGCLAGAIFSLFFGEKLGRRKAIRIGAIIMVFGVLIQVTVFRGHAPLAQFVIGRIVMGVGNGMNTSSIPTYQAECAKTKNRGLLICIEGGCIAFGTLIAYWLNFFVSYAEGSVVWRFPIAFQVIFAFFMVIGVQFAPESPRWLLNHDFDEEGTAVIAALNDQPIDSDIVQLEKRIILDSMAADQQAASFKDLLTNGKTQHFRRVCIGASSQIMQQIGGCNAVIYYFPILFERSLNESRHFSLIMGGVNMIVYAIFATGSWFLIERAGRRNLFLWGTIGQMTSMFITFGCLVPDSPAAAKGAAAGLFLYIASFGATWLPLPWLYPAEVNPLKTRTKANAVSTISNWLFNFLVVMVTPIMIEKISGYTYLIFACINASFLPFIWFFYPETKNRSLEEIDIIFAKGHSEGISYVKAANDLPPLTEEQVEEYAIRYGFVPGGDVEKNPTTDYFVDESSSKKDSN